MAVSLFIALSRRLQAPVAALLILGALQLAVAACEAVPRPVTSIRGALAAPVLAAAPQIAPDKS